MMADHTDQEGRKAREEIEQNMERTASAMKAYFAVSIIVALIAGIFLFGTKLL